MCSVCVGLAGSRSSDLIFIQCVCWHSHCFWQLQ